MSLDKPYYPYSLDNLSCLSFNLVVHTNKHNTVYSVSFDHTHAFYWSQTGYIVNYALSLCQLSITSTINIVECSTQLTIIKINYIITMII